MAQDMCLREIGLGNNINGAYINLPGTCIMCLGTFLITVF